MKWAGGFAASLAFVGCGGAGPCATGSACDEVDAGPTPVHAEAAVAVHDAAVTAKDALEAGTKLGVGDAGAKEASDDAPTKPEGGKDDAAPVPDAAVDVKAPAEGGVVDAAVDTFVCNAAQSPSQTACVLTAEYGVFVASVANGGSDVLGNGSPSAPFSTIATALKSLGSLQRVYVCDGTYAESVTVTSGVSLYGGLTCGAGGSSGSVGPWAYAPNTQATVVGATPSFALQVSAGPATVVIEDFEFDAAPGTADATSSVAAFVVSSPNVSLRRTKLVAATGFAGAAGVTGATGSVTSSTVNGVALATPTQDGQRANSHAGGGTLACTCSTGGVTTGGAGGDKVTAGANGLPAVATSVPATATGAGSTQSECFMDGIGGARGSDAPATVGGSGPAAGLGSFDGAGWHPGTVSVAGSNGAPGQGGGGGGANLGTPGEPSGGGGGCGGCGGFGGTAGTSGGASIALLAYDAPVQLIASSLFAGAAGAGGVGGEGGPGEVGGSGGASWITRGCGGGAGGTGAAGEGGGGGAGGVSFGILYAVAAPVADAMTSVTAGTAGSGGVGGDPGIDDGPAGVSAAVQNAGTL